MTLIRKAALRCDKCGAMVEVPVDGGDPTDFPTLDVAPWSGWTRAESSHLCPKCGRAYMERKRAMERELRELAGIDVIEFGI